MNVQKCARCGFVVYPAEKINLIGQNWHKACFHCEVCKTVLTANNFVSHQKRPYCQVHNPKNNTFTSVYETPVNINAKKQSEAASENKYREEGERFMSTFHYDMRSKEIEQARKASQLASQQQGYQTEFVGQQSFYSGSVTSQEIVRVTQAQKTISDVEYKRGHETCVTQFTSVADTPEMLHAKTGVSLASDVKYTEEFEQSKGKGSFPAMITPGYAMAKKANTLASNLEYKKGHEERMSKYTTVTDTPDVLLAKNQGKVVSDYFYTGEYEQQRGKGSFPAHFTPGYQVAKNAGEMASKVKYQQKYEQEIKGKASTDAGSAEFALAKENAEHFSQHAYTEEYEQQKGKGSFPAMITPGYQMAKKAHDLASDLKYKKDLNKMKGSSAYQTLNTDDNLTLNCARKTNKLVSGVEYKKDLETTKGHSINYCETPQFKNVSKMAKYTSDNKYKENYTNHMKGHYEGSGIDKKTMHAMNVRKLASNIAYKSEYEQEKHMQSEYNYPATITPSYQSQKKLEPLKDKNYRQHIDKLKFSQVTDTPEIVQARINAHQLSNLNYKANYEKTKTQYTLSQDTPELKKAKANAELASDIKYKDNWEKNKSKACDFGLDTLTLKAAKASRDLASDIKYKEAFTKNKDKAIGMDVSDSKTLHSLRVAKLSSEVAYKKNSKETQSMCHLPLDMVNQSHAKKAQALASDLDYRKKLHDYTVLPDDMKVQQAKKAYQLQSDNQYRSDLTWMKGVGWEADGCLDLEQAKKAGEQFSEKKYRQKADSVKFTQVADTPSIIHAKKSQKLQSGLAYKAGTEQTMHQYTISKDEPLFKQAKANAELLSEKTYKSSWEEQREKGFELGLDSLSILAAKATRDLASDVKYKQEYEMTKGKMIGVKTVSDDSQMAHSSKATKLQSGLNYKKEYEDTKTKYSTSLDMLTLSHAKKAQELATEKNYKTFLHKYTLLPTDMKVEWAKKAYGQQSDKKYRSDLNWMKGVGWETTGSLDIQKARKATDLASEKKYRQDVSALKFTSIEDTPEMVQAKISSKLVLDRLYREKGENEMHKYTLIGDIPEHVQAKINAMNLSESCYKESWRKIRDDGYKLRLDAIPFQAAKSSAEILSDQKYKAQFEKTKGKMIGLKGLQDDINIAHSVHATNIQSDLKYKKDSSKMHSQFHLPMDMLEVLHAKKAQSLVSDQEYRLTLHKYTTLPDDLKVQAAKRAYELQSENIYRSDLNYLRGAAWIATGALQIEGSKRATDLISEKKYRQQPYSFKHTSVTDSQDIMHAKSSSKITNERLYKEKGENFRHNYTITAERPEITQAKINTANFSDVKYKESWHALRAQGYKLTMKDIPFQAAKASTSIASDVHYKHSHVLEKGKHIGARSVQEDSHLMHCLEMGRLQSGQHYRKDAASVSGQYQLPLDMVNLVHAKKAQALASDQDYKTRIHSYTVLPDDIKVQWAKKAYDLQSQNVYKSDLNFMKGVAWDSVGAPQLESAKKAGELISDKKYRQHPDSLKFTQVADSLDIIHAKNSYMQCSERMYKSGDSDSMHKYTLTPDHPDFIRAKINAQQISDKVYKKSGEQVKSAGYDLRLDAIPFQTAKASREIASDFHYKEAFVKGKGKQVGFLSVEDDPKIRHSLAVGKLQSDNEYKKQFQETRSQFKIHGDQPEFLHAKKSQAQLSNLNYRQHLHDYTCDPNQLNVKHAKQAYQLQSDVNYKSDLNWIKGVGWTPPGSLKAEMARRAAELGLAEGVTTDEAIANYQQLMMLQRQQEFQEQQQSTTEQTETTKEFQQQGVNPDAMEILHVKRKKTIHTAFKQAKTTKSIMSQSVASHSTTSQSITNQSTKKQSIMSQSHADGSTARQMSENRAITDQVAAKSGTM
ncbi:nebulin-related-anchoring protein-like isoform X1 [Sinocyclocheilus anshuiensis]|uniref:nebulin-related-anchoring protein-like isoform X1 n=1 Tax=Sinocyclocheilus anshuiensis TaxID=1608454 RepID=UPI0007B7E4C9|nr:PREDICTED: nebulin-related-anchoring protein-like isoform X1 [Sinocyclocheilus anshuiensis]